MLSRIPVTFPQSASLSNAVDLGGNTLVGIEVPAGWTAAGLTLRASPDNINFSSVYAPAGEYLITTPVAGTRIGIAPTDLLAVDRYVQLRSGTAGSPVTQAAARTLILLARPWPGR